MPQEPTPGLVTRNFRVSLEKYEAIKEFCDYSPSSIKAADIMREIVNVVGTYCQKQLAEGKVMSLDDVVGIKKEILHQLEPGGEGK